MWKKTYYQTLPFLCGGIFFFFCSAVFAQSPQERSSGTIALAQEAGIFSVNLVEAEFDAVIRALERLTGAEVVVVGPLDRTMRASTEFTDKELWRGVKRLFEAYHLKGVLIVGSQKQISRIYLTAQEGEANDASLPTKQTPPEQANQETGAEQDRSETFHTKEIEEERAKSTLEEAVKKHLSQNPGAVPTQ